LERGRKYRLPVKNPPQSRYARYAVDPRGLAHQIPAMTSIHISKQQKRRSLAAFACADLG